MNSRIETLVTLVGPDDTIAATVDRMASGKVAFFGLAVVVDSAMRVLGVLNSGDIIRLLAVGHDFQQPVSTVMIHDPITVRPGLSGEELVAEVYRQARTRPRLKAESVAIVLVTDAAARLVSAVNFQQLVSQSGRDGERVAVYGLGFVGLTLSAALAGRGHRVTGIDVNDPLIDNLRQGRVHIHEPGLEDMLQACLERGTLQFAAEVGEADSNVSVIAVGTPVDDQGGANLAALEAVTRAIGARLCRGHLIVLRSTVPVGTTRGFVKPLLEELSGLVAGEDFHLAFTPERTVEGQAMRELRSLPQIVGGLTPACAQRAAAFWGSLTNSVVHVDGLEAAELVKLANNSFRDLSFAFSNALALLADRYNVDAFRLIGAANEGYPRNAIPLPSPGVGGYCLTKDPFLYAAIDQGMNHATLSRAGRSANRAAARYPVEVLGRWAERRGRTLEGLRVLLIGLAFKGQPETNDLRGSTAIDVAADLRRAGAEVWGWDAVVPAADIAAVGIRPVDMPEAAAAVDAILIMNNHPRNIPAGLVQRARRPGLIFDGWSLLDARQVEQHAGLFYATMGYLTPEG